MSVNRSGSMGNRDLLFSDVEHQQAWYQFSVAAGSLDGSTGERGGQDDVGEQVLGGREPVAGLERGEIAELLSVRLTTEAYVNSTSTADGAVRGSVEISREPVFQTVDGDQIVTGTGSNDGLNYQVVGPGQTLEPDVLARAQSMGFAPFQDSASGVGGAGSTTQGRFEMDFLETYGSGPLFDRNDEFYTHVGWTQWNVDDAALHVDWYLDMAWGIHEVENVDEDIYRAAWSPD
jgi:hypothetical protein